ncbi:MAG: hypothetical protein WBZ24_03045 [Anaerolineales bacterium]
MGLLATAVPALARARRLPLTRDQLMLLMAAINELFLGLDIYLAHSISGTIVPNEWIPIFFGPLAGITLLIAGAIALRNRPLATLLATVTFVGSIAVGLLGAYFHLTRALLPSAAIGQRASLDLLVWAPPILGPLTFCLVGMLGISAAWVEDPPDSGVLRLLGQGRLHMPMSKTRAYLLLVGLGILATLISSVLDHARTGFHNPWLWVPTAVGTFATVITISLASLKNIRPSDARVAIASMLMLIAVGLIGLGLHVQDNLTSQGVVVGERFLRGAPILAPTLYANMGMLGLIAMLEAEDSPPR